MKMPIDPTGTSPVPTPEAEEIPDLNMKCKRPGCDSITAQEIKIPGNTTASGRHMYRCKKCNHTWNTNLGGAVNF